MYLDYIQIICPRLTLSVTYKVSQGFILFYSVIIPCTTKAPFVAHPKLRCMISMLKILRDLNSGCPLKCRAFLSKILVNYC